VNTQNGFKCSKCGFFVQVTFPHFDNVCFQCLPVEEQNEIRPPLIKSTQTIGKAKGETQ